MSQTEHLLRKLPNDVGGLPADRIERADHVLEPWEKRCHALADVLDFHKIINTEEKRRGVESLGTEIVGKLTYYERWIAAFAFLLFQKASGPIRIMKETSMAPEALPETLVRAGSQLTLSNLARSTRTRTRRTAPSPRC
jgi:hypothetical protein